MQRAGRLGLRLRVPRTPSAQEVEGCAQMCNRMLKASERSPLRCGCPAVPHKPGTACMQARRLEVRLRAPRAPGAPERKDYVHMLNCTLTATERTLCCVLENYQTPEGVRCAPGLLHPIRHTCGMLSRLGSVLHGY